MFGDLQQIDDANEAGLAGHIRSDIGKRDLEQPRHDDMAGRQRISSTDLHARALPEPNAAGYLARPDPVTQRRKELHAVGFQVRTARSTINRLARLGKASL